MAAKRFNLINIILLVLIIPAVSFAVRDYIVGRHRSGGAEPVRLAAPGAAKVPALNDYARILESGAFPSPTKTLTPLGAPERVDRGPAPAARPSGAGIQGLELIGTYVGPRSFAVVYNSKDRTEESFHIGDDVFGAGTLKEVSSDHVSILSGGGVVTLSIKEAAVPKAPPVGRSPQARAVRTPRNNGTRYSVKTGDNVWSIDRKAVLNALEDMSQVLSDARLTPIFTAGKPEGFRVTEIKPRGVFDAIGLKNGDILKRVNGYEMTTPERAIQVLTALKGQRSIDLDVVRAGQRMSFHYDIN